MKANIKFLFVLASIGFLSAALTGDVVVTNTYAGYVEHVTMHNIVTCPGVGVVADFNCEHYLNYGETVAYYDGPEGGDCWHTYDPGGTGLIPVATIVTATSSHAAGAGDDRPSIGIGENFTCHLSNNASVSWNVTGARDPVSTNATTQISVNAPFSAGSITVSTNYNGQTLSKTLTVFVPNGMTYSFLADQPTAIGPSGTTLIGAHSTFTATVQPASVCFDAAGIYGHLQENFQGGLVTWPSGAQFTSSSGTPGIVPDHNNQWTDTSYTGIGQATSLQNGGGSYVDFQWNSSVNLQYIDKDNNPINFKTGVIHHREYRGSDKKARVGIEANGSTAYGSWMGPYSP